ncbi:hypothetical protein CUS89_04710 [Enterococcus mundtii]|uniref:Uncharacterized protein n=2 Tax=Enterococcus mundtii TaxID=53346 RepID=A0A2S7RWJ7_ENTMU|nr:hypothetical protein CUS89_04710 [Enterococcus mundtii]
MSDHEKQVVTSKRRFQLRTQAIKKKQDVLAELRHCKTNTYIIKKHHLTLWQVRFVIKREVIRQIKKGTRMEVIAHQLNMSLDQIREVRNTYINNHLINGASKTDLAKNLHMERQQILAIRNHTIEKKLVQKVSIKEVAHRWRLTESGVEKIREQAILRRLQMTHPEDVANTFHLSVEDVLRIRQKISQPLALQSHVTKESKKWLKNINQQEQAIVASLEQGKPTRVVAQQLNINQKFVIRTRTRHIEQAFEKKQPLAEISERFYTPADELRKLRNQRILYYREDGIKASVLARKFNMKTTALQKIVYQNKAVQQPMKKDKQGNKTEPLPAFSAETYAKFMEGLKNGKSMADIGVSLNLDHNKTYAIRNHLLLTKLNNGEKTKDVAKQFNTNATNIYQIMFQADLVNYPNIKRRTNSYLTEEQTQDVKRMIREGKTNSQIAKLLSVKKSLVISKRKSMKKMTRLSNKKRRITDEQKSAILADSVYLDKVTNAMKHGVSIEAVRVLSKRNDKMRIKKISERKKDMEKLKNFKQIEQEIKRQAKVENIKRVLQEKPQQFRSSKHTSLLQR